MIEVEQIEIVRRLPNPQEQDNFCDGYGTLVFLNGKSLPSQTARVEKEITVLTEAGLPVQVHVLFYDGYEEVFCPRKFDMTLGTLRVTTRPDRNPCLITVDGVEPYVFKLKAHFAEGESVLVEMSFRPSPSTSPDVIVNRCDTIPACTLT